MIESANYQGLSNYRLEAEDLEPYKYRFVSTEDLGMEDETEALAEIKDSISEVHRILTQVDPLKHHRFYSEVDDHDHRGSHGAGAFPRSPLLHVSLPPHAHRVPPPGLI